MTSGQCRCKGRYWHDDKYYCDSCDVFEVDLTKLKSLNELAEKCRMTEFEAGSISGKIKNDAWWKMKVEYGIDEELSSNGMFELVKGFLDDYKEGNMDRFDFTVGLLTHIEINLKKRLGIEIG